MLRHNKESELPDLQLPAPSTPLMMEYENVARMDGIAIGDVKSFFGGFIASQVLGLLTIVFASVWVSKYLGGIGWTSPNQIFNYHPLLMVIGMIFIFGDAILVYRVLRNEQKKMLKILHASLNGSALVLSLMGLWAVFHFHNANNIPNLYSLHSWLGLLTIILFISQFIIGFVSFLFPGITTTYRRLIMPYHVYIGLTLFAMSCGTALIGITEKAFFSLGIKKDEKNPGYGSLPPAAYVLNLLGITILLFGIVVAYLVTNSQFKRRPLPEEQALQLQLDETSSLN